MNSPPEFRTMVEGRTIPLEASEMARFRWLDVAEIVAACVERHPPPHIPANTGCRSHFTTRGLEQKKEFIKTLAKCDRSRLGASWLRGPIGYRQKSMPLAPACKV